MNDNYINIEAGLYPGAEEILEAIKTESNITGFEWSINPLTKKVKIQLPYGYNMIFENSKNIYNIPNILGFKEFYIGQTSENIVANFRDDVEHPEWYYAEGEYPVDIHAGRFLMFVNTNFIDNQIVSDTKAPTLRIVPLLGKMRNDKIHLNQAVYHETFTDLQFKDILSTTLSRIVVELRDDTGQLIPFHGEGRTAITLKFRKISSSYKF